MGRFRFINWYRLKSNQEHLFIKISAREYLDEQPETNDEAEELARETIEATQDIRDIVEQDKRIVVITLDMRDCCISEVNFIAFFKYAKLAASQGLDIERMEVRGASDLWKYISSFLPKYTRDRLILLDTA